MMSEERLELPEAFVQKMRRLLGQEYEAFAESYEGDRVQGLRINPQKTGWIHATQEMAARFGLSKVPWAREGYYYDHETRPGKHVFHDAGVFYIQEPSAMAAVELLDPQPGERILDLCAAPGGKTTQIGGRLSGQGFLFTNEIHPARAKVLSQNVERMGISNSVVSSEEPAALAGRFPCFFDRILVDAPCSGEGMFRKDPEARGQWSPEHVRVCARRQKEILDEAALMLKPGGRLVYSTCTFSPEEDEGTVEGFLRRNPDFSVEPMNICLPLSPGRPSWTDGGDPSLAQTFRIWPHEARGEGHYLAVLKKDPDSPDLGIRKPDMPSCVKDPKVLDAWRTFLEEALTEEGVSAFGEDTNRHLILFGDQLYRLPPEMPDLKGLRILRPGLHLGTLKKNRLEPSHGLALCLKREQVRRWVSYNPQEPELLAYLRGETLPAMQPPEAGRTSSARRAGSSENGWTLVLADSYSLGWAKQAAGTLKNHYPKGLRRS